jgi:hypothetical protein
MAGINYNQDMRPSVFSRRLACYCVAGGLIVAGCQASRPVPTASASPRPAPPGPAPMPLSVATVQLPGPPLPPPAKDRSDNMAANLLSWDTLEQEHTFLAGETNATFTFHFRNVSTEPIVIYDSNGTCNCTSVRLPAKPWTIPPGGTGEFQATIHFQKRNWSPVDYVIVFTSKGNRALTIRVAKAK